MSSSAAALRAAIHDALVADGTLTALLGGPKVYDEPPQGAAFPYVTLGEEMSEIEPRLQMVRVLRQREHPCFVVASAHARHRVDDCTLEIVALGLRIEVAQIGTVFRRRAIAVEALNRFDAEIHGRILAVDQCAHAVASLGIVAAFLWIGIRYFRATERTFADMV